MSTNKDVINSGNLNTIASAIQRSRVGDALATVARTVSGSVSSNVLTLPNSTTDRAKANSILMAYAKGATVTGYKTPVVKETAAPTTGQVTISPGGDIQFAASDAVSQAVVVYTPVEGTHFSDNVAVTASGVATLAASREAMQILTASLDTGGGISSPGAKTLIARGGTPSAGEACLAATGLSVSFNGTDAGTGGRATITYMALPGTVGAYGPFGEKLAEDYPEP